MWTETSSLMSEVDVTILQLKELSGNATEVTTQQTSPMAGNWTNSQRNEKRKLPLCLHLLKGDPLGLVNRPNTA